MVCLFIFAGDINSDVPLSSTFIAGQSKVLHLFGLPHHVRQSLFFHAAHSVSRTLQLYSDTCVSHPAAGREDTSVHNVTHLHAIVAADFSNGLSITGDLIRSVLHADVASRRQVLLEEVYSFQQSNNYLFPSPDYAMPSSITEDLEKTAMKSHTAESLGVDYTSTSEALFTHMKHLLQITSELCTGPEQLMERLISRSDDISGDNLGGAATLNKEYYNECLSYFERNIDLTKELMAMNTNNVESSFAFLGVEVLAEAQNTKLEMLLRYYSATAVDGGEHSNGFSGVEGVEGVVETGKEILLTLNTLLELAHEDKVHLNSQSVLFRIATSHYNLAMFCLGHRKVDLAKTFARHGVPISAQFVSNEVGRFPKYMSMHAALLSCSAQCLSLSGEHDHAIELSTSAIHYATYLYKTVVTEKNIYCGELFEHYLKRLFVIESDVNDLKYALRNIDMLKNDCHIELSAGQDHIISLALRKCGS